MTQGLNLWHTTAADNAAAGTINWAEGQSPATVNDSARQTMADVRLWYENMEWRDWGHTPVYSAATAFTISNASSLSSIYSVNRRIKTIDAGGTSYGTIVDTTWVSSTQTVHVDNSVSLTNPLTSVAVGFDIANSPIHAAGVLNAARTDTANTFTVSQNFTGGITAASTIALVNAAVNFSAETSIASATAVNIALASNNILITGNVTVSTFATAVSGLTRTVRFQDTAVLAYSAAMLLPGAANITVKSNDCGEFESLGSGNWICRFFTRAAAPVAKSWKEIEVQSPSATATVAFTTTLTSTDRFRIDYDGTQNTVGARLLIRFNGDSTAGRYQYAAYGLTGGGVGTNSFSTSDNAIVLDDSATAGEEFFGNVEFKQALNNLDVNADFKTSRAPTGNNSLHIAQGNGHYGGAAGLTSVTILVTSGTITGTLILSKWV